MDGEFTIESGVSEIADSLGLGTSATESQDGIGAEDLGLTPSEDTQKVAEPAAETPAPTQAPTEAPATPPTSGPVKPDTWRPEALAEWEKIPPAAQAEILKREQDMVKGLEAYRGEVSFAKEFKSVLEPYMPQIQAAGVPPTQLVANILGAQNVLINGSPEQKAGLLHRLAQQAGLAFEGLVIPEAPHTDPEVKALHNRLAQIESAQQAEMQGRLNAQRAELGKQVDAFFSDPKNVYAEDVADDMVALIKASQGPVNLAEIYEKAVYANPMTRAKEIDRLAAESRAKEVAAQKQHAEAARRAAAANVKTRAREGGGAAILGSMEDTMRETMEKIKSRSA